MSDAQNPPVYPEPPYDDLPPRFRDTPYEELPPALQRRIVQQLATADHSEAAPAVEPAP